MLGERGLVEDAWWRVLGRMLGGGCLVEDLTGKCIYFFVPEVELRDNSCLFWLKTHTFDSDRYPNFHLSCFPESCCGFVP